MGNDCVVTNSLCEAKMDKHDERFRRDKERLDTHDTRLAKMDQIIAELSRSNALLAQMVERHDKDADAQSARLRTVENRPSALWDKLIGGIIGAVSGGLVAAVMALIFK